MTLFKTFGMQNGDMVIFFLEVFQKSKILKNAVSGRWCLDSKPLAYKFRAVYQENMNEVSGG